MYFTIYSKKTGEILRSGDCPEDWISHQVTSDDEGVISGLSDPLIHYVDCDSLSVKEKPSMPGECYYWDAATVTWLPDMSNALRTKLSEVGRIFDEKTYGQCNGFDADKVSRERISGTIARLQRGDGLPTGWMGWRDAENQMHWANETPEQVLVHLQELSRTIEDREQALLVAGWTHKANIAALTDIDAIIGYDVTASWPV